jgi:hypothetical protein
MAWWDFKMEQKSVIVLSDIVAVLAAAASISSSSAAGHPGAGGAAGASRDDDRLGLVGKQLLETQDAACRQHPTHRDADDQVLHVALKTCPDDPMILAGLVNNMPLIEGFTREEIQP